MKTAVFTTTDVRSLIEGRKTRFSKPIVKLKGFGYITEFQESKMLGFDWAFRDRKQRWNEVTTPRILASSPFQTGDKIGIREKWCYYVDETGCTNYSRYLYYEDNPHVECIDADGFLAYTKKGNEASPWQSPVTMPPEAIRIYVEILSVKAQRLQEISWEDAEQEGCYGYRPTQYEPTHEFKDKMIKAKGMGFWNSNPWMWSFSFRVLTTKGERG